MTELKPGDKAPAFDLPAGDGSRVSLKSYKGRNLILYFYPRDDTPGCTTESCDFRDNLAAFGKLNADVLGISRDNPASHDKFRKKFDLNFPLASDEDTETIKAYGAWVEKSMYGKKYMGIDRSTFLIDEKGVIREIWRKVKVTGHVQAVAASLKAAG